MNKETLFLLYKVQGQLNLLMDAEAHVYIDQTELGEVIPSLKKDIDQAIAQEITVGG